MSESSLIPRDARAAAVAAARANREAPSGRGTEKQSADLRPQRPTARKTGAAPTLPPHSNDTDTDAAVAEIRKKKHARERQFGAWDSLLKSEAFEDFLFDRGLKVDPLSVPLPHCTEAEQQVLGACLVAETLGDLKTVPMVIAKLHPQMLYHSQIHRPIFGAIVHLDRERNRSSMRKGFLIDLLTVNYYMKRNKLQNDDCPAVYLTALHEMSNGTANVTAYLDIVIEMSKMRHLFRLGHLVSELSPDADPQQLAVATQNAVQHIQMHGWCDLEAMLMPHK